MIHLLFVVRVESRAKVVLVYKIELLKMFVFNKINKSVSNRMSNLPCCQNVVHKITYPLVNILN